jgi:hypothetical protein
MKNKIGIIAIGLVIAGMILPITPVGTAKPIGKNLIVYDIPINPGFIKWNYKVRATIKNDGTYTVEGGFDTCFYKYWPSNETYIFLYEYHHWNGLSANQSVTIPLIALNVYEEVAPGEQVYIYVVTDYYDTVDEYCEYDNTAMEQLTDLWS